MGNQSDGVVIAELRQSILDLIDDYNEFNGAQIEEMPGPPNELQLQLMINKNRPVVMNDSMLEYSSALNWTMEELKKLMGDKVVTVARTPFGNADDVSQGHFVEPLEEKVKFSEMLDWLSAVKHLPANEFPQDGVRYVQLQNSNIDTEFASLRRAVPGELIWTRGGLEGTLDATNIWIGNHHSTSSLHKDPYENLYAQICGKKTFVLIPPNQFICLQEKRFPRARYVHNDDRGFQVQALDPAEEIDWVTVDPDNTTNPVFVDHCRPMRVTLLPGQVLYLPSLWYHKVTQESDDEGKCISVNWWYDMDYASNNYREFEFMRKVVDLTGRGQS